MKIVLDKYELPKGEPEDYDVEQARKILSELQEKESEMMQARMQIDDEVKQRMSKKDIKKVRKISEALQKSQNVEQIYLM